MSYEVKQVSVIIKAFLKAQTMPPARDFRKPQGGGQKA
jgi:hypothetical protein